MSPLSFTPSYQAQICLVRFVPWVYQPGDGGSETGSDKIITSSGFKAWICLTFTPNSILKQAVVVPSKNGKAWEPREEGGAAGREHCAARFVMISGYTTSASLSSWELAEQNRYRLMVTLWTYCT